MRRRRYSDSTQVSFFSFQDIITGLAGIMIILALMLVLDLTTSAFSPPTMAKVVSEASVRQQMSDLEEKLRQLDKQKQQLSNESSMLAKLDPQKLRRRVEELEETLRKSQSQGTAKSAERRAKEDELVELTEDHRKRMAEIRSLAAAKSKLDRSPRRVVFTLPGEQDSRKQVLLVEISDKQVQMQPLGSERAPLVLDERAPDGRVAWVKRQLIALPAGQYDVLLLVKPSAFGDRVNWVEFFLELGYRIGSEPLEEDRSTISPG